LPGLGGILANQPARVGVRDREDGVDFGLVAVVMERVTRYGRKIVRLICQFFAILM
jgi:hypothetical protein